MKTNRPIHFNRWPQQFQRGANVMPPGPILIFLLMLLASVFRIFSGTGIPSFAPAGFPLKFHPVPHSTGLLIELAQPIPTKGG